MKKILIFALKDVCYNSYLYFEDKLGEMLRTLGCDVTFFRAKNEPLAHLEKFCDATFDAMFEFNSDLPKIKMDDGSYFLDHIHAPFFDVLLDHPLYHHDMLKQQLMNFHVICLDENHKNYILQNYPHIKSVHVCSMTGEEILPAVPMEKRPVPVLFSGTYTPPAEVWNAIETCPPFLGDDIKKLIDMMLIDPALPLEAAVEKLIPMTSSLISEKFALHMQAYFLADTYLRAYEREQLIQTLIAAKVPLFLYGSDWDKMKHSDAACVTLHGSVPYLQTFSIMANSKITLNIMPLFKNGSHDRIPAAMLNHSVSVTDTSLLLQKRYTNGTDIVFYELDQMKALPDILLTLLSDNAKMEQIAAAGYHNASTTMTWQAVGSAFYSILTDL